MLKIIACLRRLFAVDRSYQVLGTVMNDAVTTIYIPALKEKASHEEDPDDRQAILELLEEFKPYANPNTPQGREFAEVAARVVGNEANRYRGTNLNVDDVIQEIAGDFYESRGQRSLAGFPEKERGSGPLDLMRYWAKILWLHAKHAFREAERHSIHKHEMEEDEGSGSDPYKNLPKAEQGDFEEFLSDMTEYVHKNARRFSQEAFDAELAVQIFDIWIDLVNDTDDLEDVGSEKVQPVWERIRQKNGQKAGRSLFYLGWKAMKETIRHFMIEEKRHGMAAGETMVERVAKAGFRRRLAKWILGE